MSLPFFNMKLLKIEHKGDKTLITHVENIAPILRRNELERKNRPWKGDLRKIATIPYTEFLRLQAVGITEDPEAFKKWLKLHPEYLTTGKNI